MVWDCESLSAQVENRNHGVSVKCMWTIRANEGFVEEKKHAGTLLYTHHWFIRL